jgi:hypothetical protein
MSVMKINYLIILLGLFFTQATYSQLKTVDQCKQCIILAEQSEHRVVMVDVPTRKIIWEWKPALSNVKAEHVKWFSNPSDAKVVYDGKYVLTCASGGGVALIRIADRKTVFYAYAGGNTHSIELLPDGNIVSASSTDHHLTLFQTDTLQFPEHVHQQKIPIVFGHNVVWDHVRQRLWSAAMNELIAFKYNFNCAQPSLEWDTAVTLPGTEAHDLFPVYRQQALWITNTTHVYRYEVGTNQLIQDDIPLQAHIKSISSGPEDFPVIILKPKTSWWSDEVLDTKGNTVFVQPGLKIYKARWVLPNRFSYPASDTIRICK